MTHLSAGFNLKFSVPVIDLDPTYHHISHWVSLRYMELCRIEFLAALGSPVESLIAIDAFPVVTSIQVRYLREIFKETLTLSCSQIAWAGRACRILQRITKNNDKLAVEAIVELKFLSQLKKRSIEIPSVFIASVEKSGLPSLFDTTNSEV